MNKNDRATEIAENAALVERYRDLHAKITAGSASLRERREADQVGVDLVSRFEPLIRKMVRRYRTHPSDDIRQEATFALLAVVRQPTFDSSRPDDLAGLIARAIEYHLKKSTCRSASSVSTGGGRHYRHLRALVLKQRAQGRELEEIYAAAAESLEATPEQVREVIASLEPAADYETTLAETGAGCLETLRHQNDAREHLNRALGDLPEPVRLAWRLQHGYLSDTHSIQLSASEITDMLNRLGLSTPTGQAFSVGAVNGLIRRANELLRRALAAHRDDLLVA